MEKVNDTEYGVNRESANRSNLLNAPVVAVFKSVLTYAFVNSASRLAYITDETFAFRGTWSGTATYSPPLDVVDYNNGKWIATVSNSATPPLGSSKWSQMSLIGTISPSSPFEIASTALATANGAMSVAVAATGTANEALSIAQAGTILASQALALANTAYNIAVAGTEAGSYTPISSGTNMVFVTGQSLSYLPTSVVCTVEIPDASVQPLTASLIGRPSTDGFVAKLSGTTTQPGYFLGWIMHR